MKKLNKKEKFTINSRRSLYTEYSSEESSDFESSLDIESVSNSSIISNISKMGKSKRKKNNWEILKK